MKRVGLHDSLHLGGQPGPLLEQTGELLADVDGWGSGTLVLVVGIKLAALVIAAASGFRGGRIFPAVFIGVGLGLLAHNLLPSVPVSLAVACAVDALEREHGRRSA